MCRLIPATFLVVLVLLVGCSEQTTDKIPNIRTGKDPCAECRMIISDKRFAAAFITTDGETIKFDDIGCLRVYERKHAVMPQQAWVHDYLSEDWIEQAKAVFVHSEAMVTPMGYGIAAFFDNQKARQFLEKHEGQKILWDEISETLHKDHA